MTHVIRFCASLAVIVAVTGWGMAAARSAELVASTGDWNVYRHGSGDDRVCFATVAPIGDEPRGSGQGARLAYVTSWPQAGIATEISVLLGSAGQHDGEIEVEVGKSSFTMLTDTGRAYLEDLNDEARLLDAMRRGRTMTVTMDRDGATHKVSYSLVGVTAAVEALSTHCR